MSLTAAFSAATATTQSYLQLGCFPGQLANKALKEPTTAPQTGLEIIVRVFGGFGLRLCQSVGTLLV